MADKLRAAREVLAAKRKLHQAYAVTYTRGANSVPLQATYGTSLLKLPTGSGGFRFEQTERDFIFPLADLVLGGTQAEPRADDRITDHDGKNWSVRDIPGEKCWKPNDAQGVSIRVHAKRAPN